MTDTPTPDLLRSIVVRASDFEPVTVIDVSEQCFLFLHLHPLDTLRFMLTDLPPQLRPNPPGRLQAQGSLDSAPHVSSCYPEVVQFNGRHELHLVLRDPLAVEKLADLRPHQHGWVENTEFRLAWIAALEGTAGKRGRA